MTDAALVLDAVGEPNRRRLLQLLHERREATVSELVDSSGLRQPQVSKHLKVLAGATLVAVRSDGRYRRYRLDGRGLEVAHDWFGSFEDVWRERFDALDELVSADSSITPTTTSPTTTSPTTTSPTTTSPITTSPTTEQPTS